MTRVLYWNIQQFSWDKLRGDVVADDHLRLILGILEQQPPDVVVIVEVVARMNVQVWDGLPLGSGSDAGKAAVVLVEALRQVTGNANWSLIPPACSGTGGKREAVAIYYDAARLEFTGPWVWSPNAAAGLNLAQPPTATNVGHAADYTNWNQWGPAANRAWPAATGAVLERRGAPQMVFHDANDQLIGFPYEEHRSPIHASFKECAGGRSLKLFAMHTTPGRSTAPPAVRSLARVQELIPQADEVTAIVGDFNVDTFRNFNPYEPLLQLPAQFRMLLDPRVNHAGNPVDVRKPYCVTHLLPIDEATPYNADPGPPSPQRNVYPRFGCFGSMIRNQISDSAAIDNALVGYGPNAAPAAGAPRATIVNRIVGSPYDADQNHLPAVADLRGGLNYPSSMAGVVPLPGGRKESEGPHNFYLWSNFGKIRDTSDHLPLLVEV
jgi:hypothetical protein